MTALHPAKSKALVDGWRVAASHTTIVSAREDGSVEIRISARGDRMAEVKLIAPDHAPPLRAEIVADTEEVEIVIEPSQSHVVIESLVLQSRLERLTISSPVWPGDPTELGTAECRHLTTRATILRVGGDDLEVGLEFDPRLPTPRTVAVLPDSFVVFSKGLAARTLKLGDRSRAHISNGDGVNLGKIGINCELSGGETPLTLYEWDLASCDGQERFHLTGVLPLGYDQLRQVRRRIAETNDDLFATYQPVEADKVPLDLSRSAAAVSEWVQNHALLVEKYCLLPAVRADSRWLEYEDRRRSAKALTTEWAVLNFAMKPLGHGLKALAPFRLWLAATVVVVLAYWWRSDIPIDLRGGKEAWWRGVVLWVEAILTPTGLFSLTSESSNSVLEVEGTGLRLARFLTSIPFAATLLALRARYRLPKFADARL